MELVSDIREACAKLPATIETFPFDTQNLVFKVGGEDPDSGAPVFRMYAMVNVTEDPLRLLVKCELARTARLRDEFPDIVPAAYFGGHWIFLPLDGSLPTPLPLELLHASYDLVVKRNLPRRVRERLATR
ncbi:MmcQ/YjbR family DNA-binding protein [Deinococcus yavapaiensis]|uniref:Putative DNA-binding protein (MmcQ/YjbR family) n=1 Tax=Deinococcus yavapaiensis KR-236 TaxID=694435 RepID=A0A318SA62_9DEIO|nr:MmcQ/YjbR family DNA-binding protein [Deinococcus yavapaiensis]PYE54950.1 putative DNA-binding protein (MmcQ/YjbR family) [Deinococcus yavapaiensis KR-236]